MAVKDVLELVKKNKVEIVDFKFVDVPGLWHHFSIPASELTADLFEDGIGFDGSSIRGFQTINESDMLLIPDVESALLDPFTEHVTLSLVCNVIDAVTREPYSRDPRYIAQKAEKHLKSTGIADISYWGPEIEFFIFDSVRFDQSTNQGFYFIDSEEGYWNAGNSERQNLGYKIRYQDLRSEMVRNLERCGIKVEVHHHEVGTGGQTEIDMRYGTLTRMADQVLLYKYVVKNTARKRGKTVTCMPKPLFQDNGSGMHTHQSLWKGGKNLFYDKKGYGLISETARYYIGGLIKHAHALCGFIAPTTNSYRRLVPGYEAPINLVYSARNRSACVRIPMYSTSEKAKRIEFRTPDPSCNPYLAFSAMLMAGLDGIRNKVEPPKPIDKDLYELEPEEAAKVKNMPASLDQALDAVEKDHEFLLRGDVFTKDIIETWLEYKRKKEVDPLRLRPHPHEFALYFDI
jgi:glutamine synthetase